MKTILAVLVLVPALAWGMDAKTAATTFGVTEAWIVRAQQAVAWSQGQQEPVTVDAVVAEMVSRLNAIVVQQEQSHGIDPATGQKDPARLVADLAVERAAREFAQSAVTRWQVEADSLRPWTTIVKVKPDGRICVGETDCEQSATPEEVVKALQDFAALTSGGTP